MHPVLLNLLKTFKGPFATLVNLCVWLIQRNLDLPNSWFLVVADAMMVLLQKPLFAIPLVASRLPWLPVGIWTLHRQTLSKCLKPEKVQRKLEIGK